MATRVASPVFVGRRHELDQVDAALDRAFGGQPAVVLVAGEAGIGKTRFVAEVAGRARAHGARVLEGGCVQIGAEGLPFGPFMEALRGLTYQLPPPVIDVLLGVGRSELVRLMPQLLREGEQPAGVAVSDPSAQARLFEHVLLLFERLGSQMPLLLVVEDVHWADRSTIELLGFLARNLRHGPILLVATYRSDEIDRSHPLLPFLAVQERSGRSATVELARFDRSELVAQLTAILGRRPDLELVEQIALRSQGNALFVEELLATGASSGRLPRTLREALLARFAVLTDRTQNLIRVAAVGGARIEPDLLRTVAGVTELELETALREAIAEHVLSRQDEGTPDHWTFRHALVQEAVYDELLPSERVRLHAAFADGLTKAADADSVRAGEIAYHYQAARDLPHAFEAWIDAGLEAETRFGFAVAAASFDHALDLWDQVPDASLRARLSRVDLLTRAARAMIGIAPYRSVEYMRAAIGLVDPLSESTRAGLLHERLAHYSLDARDYDLAQASYREAVRLVPVDPPSAARAWVLSGLGTFLLHLDRADEAATLSAEAYRIASAVPDAEAELRALVPLGICLVALGDLAQGVALLRRAVAVAMDLGNVDEVARAMGFVAIGLFEAGHDREAYAAALEAEAYDAEHGLASGRGVVIATVAADASMALGRWDDAAAALDRADRFQTPGTPELVREASRALLEALRGRNDVAARSADRAREIDGRYSFWNFRGPAELSLWRGEPGLARQMVRGALASMGTAQPTVRTFGWALWLGLRAEADLAVSARAHKLADELEEALASGADYLGRARALLAEVIERRPYYSTMAAAWLALGEAEYGRLDGRSDAGAWSVAADAFAPQPYFHAYALMRQGEALLARGGSGLAARAALDEAHAIATRLGAEPLRGAVEALRTIGSLAAPPGQPEGPDDVAWGRSNVSPREREVLALLAAGRSDRQIAEALYISKKTASVHVANIKGKLGAQSRVDIVMRAIQLGLVDVPSPGTT